jgi:hypothetical protein
MSKLLLRRAMQGILSMILGAIATYLAVYITNKLLGEPTEDEA